MQQPRKQTLGQVAIAAVSLWAAVWLWIGRYAMLDDALIHLRYADMLQHTHMFTFDGVTRTFGCSSPLYVALLALIRVAWTSPMLPKVVSLLFYFVMLAFWIRHARRDVAPASTLEWLLILVFVGPMGQRWLTDGMETSLVGISSILLATTLMRFAERANPTSRSEFFGMAVVGFLLVWLRIDLALIAATGSVGLVLWRLEAMPAERRAGAFLSEVIRNCHLALGVGVGAATVRMVMGQMIPDTAIAKSGAPVSILQAIWGIAITHGSAMSFGAGVFLIWAASLVLAVRHHRDHTLSILAANGALLLLVLIIAHRGQQVQGIRHVLWSYLFNIAWNIQVLRAGGESKEREWWSPARAQKVLAAGLLVLAVGWLVEARFVLSVFTHRGQALLEMESEDLDRLKDKFGMASDVGFVSYFTQARLFDVHGLINGREFAAMGEEERLRHAATLSPDFLFVNASQIKEISPYLPIGPFVIWHEYSFANVRSLETHYLALRPQVARELGVSGRLIESVP